MNELTNICYKKNFISKVICKVDFINNIQNSQVLDEKLQRIALKHFPVQNMDEIVKFNQIRLNLNSSKPDISDKVTDMLLRKFSSNTERNTVKISNAFVLFDIQDYSSFTSLYAAYSDIMTELFSIGNIAIKRIGLRYINQFDLSQMRVQKNYFSGNIASALERKFIDIEDSFCLTRATHKIEYKVDDMKLSFAYGLNNKNYPNVISDNALFMLDYDCYKEEVVERLDETIRILKTAHSNIQALFESSITDSLRKIMDEKHE